MRGRAVAGRSTKKPSTGAARTVHLPIVDDVSSPGEEKVPVLVEGDRHDAVAQVEGLLDAVAVMDVNVDIQHARVVPG
eukprot:232934-Chlamydomonas_euryale.AAC.1